MKLIILVLLPLFGCTSNNATKPVKGEGGAIEVKAVSNKPFDSFLESFREVDLPFSLTVGGPFWINFSDSVDSHVIPRTMVKQYFYGDDNEKFQASSFDQFYYGVTFNFNENVIGVTYYGTSKEEDGISGYRLVLFNEDGEFLQSLLIAGTKGMFDVEMQMEAEIKKDEIMLNRIDLDLDRIKNLNHFEGKQKLISYKVDENGVVEKINETEYQIKTLTVNKDEHYRIEIIE